MKNLIFNSLMIVLVVLLLAGSISFAQKVDFQVDGKRILNTVSYLSSDQFMGRRTNTEEFRKLQDWIVAQFKSWGLEPAGENGTFFQSVPITRDYVVTYGMPKLVINGREFFTRYDDFNLDQRSTPDTRIKAEVMFAGYGISSPAKGLDEYAGLDVRGKIVLVLNGNPSDYAAPRARLMPEEFGEASTQTKSDALENWDVEARDSTKFMTAYRKGAAGIMFYNPQTETSPFRRGRMQIEKSPFKRDFVVLTNLSEDVLHWLLWTDPQMSSRGFNTWFGAVRNNIKGTKTQSFATKLRAEVTGFEKTLFKGEAFNDFKGRNIIAKVSGYDSILKNEYVIVGAHLDHVGVTNGQIYNGAEDNASGSAVLIELARLLQSHRIQTKRTLVLCLWTGDELGLIGSNYWVKNPPDSVKMDQVVAYFNMDMVGLGTEIDAPGALNFPSIWDVIRRDQNRDVLQAVKPRTGGPGGSDHFAFIDLGIEALALMTHGEGGHPDYHDTGDDSYKLSPEILRKTGQFVLQGMINLGNETNQPLLVADRQNLYFGLRWPILVINSELGVRGGWTRLPAKSPKELSQVILKKIAELKQPQQSEEPFMAMRRQFGVTLRNTGIYGAESFYHDAHFLQIAKGVLDVGRLDLKGDDGVWFNQGLTARGDSALKILESEQIALHLVAPGRATLLAVLEKTNKPFMVTGFSDLDDSLVAKMNAKKVILCVDCDPQDVAGCVARLEELKGKFGDTDNLLLNVVSATGLETAKQKLYMELIRKGWEKNQIYAIGGAGASRRSYGNLDVLPGGPPSFFGAR